ncbi:MAG: hypothetical protein ACREOP_05340 [Thermodesulfobacteriota bacterium]
MNEHDIQQIKDLSVGQTYKAFTGNGNITCVRFPGGYLITCVEEWADSLGNWHKEIGITFVKRQDLFPD